MRMGEANGSFNPSTFCGFLDAREEVFLNSEEEEEKRIGEEEATRRTNH